MKDSDSAQSMIMFYLKTSAKTAVVEHIQFQEKENN